ncbi:hypothetical protein [Leptolyngbya sp. FACHB-16]|uniref:hypothetical protein n=1 Tax=unclassified Leptolyngbya TaxID=2650499 RepID=UPI0016824A0F|nr:hypothetical protein [Leptolyngbya sp. FACHB-16]MBD2155227.1 hypothetical protein [Leptolyngbya sp. FACHB-16]
MPSFALSDVHLALLMRCHLRKIGATLTIDAPSQEIVDALMELRHEWIAADSPCHLFYLYVNGKLLNGFSVRGTTVRILSIGTADP